MKSQAFAQHFQAWLQEEIAAQRSLSKLLERQLNAVRRSSTKDVSSAVQGVELELRHGTRRELKRKTLTEAFSKASGLPVTVLTLGRIVEVLGEQGVAVDILARLRCELRDTVAGVMKLNRRVATLARYHQGLFNEVLGVLAEAAEGVDVVPTSGTLIDARV